MAKATATLETVKSILETRSENVNQRTVVRFIPNDQIKLVVLDDEGNLDARGTGFTPKGGEEVLKYKFLLTRKGRTFPVFITLGAFTSLPIAKRGFATDAAERQRQGVNNAVFADFEMKSAEDIISALKAGVVCREVFATTESQAQCYRWDRI